MNPQHEPETAFVSRIAKALGGKLIDILIVALTTAAATASAAMTSKGMHSLLG